MDSESSYKQAYFDIFRQFAEKVLSTEKEEYNLNFGPSFLYDNVEEWKNGKAKYTVQSSNPVKMLKNLEKELHQLIIRNPSLQSKIDYNCEYLSSAVQEAIKFEGISWKLIYECVWADYIHFEDKKKEGIE